MQTRCSWWNQRAIFNQLGPPLLPVQVGADSVQIGVNTVLWWNQRAISIQLRPPLFPVTDRCRLGSHSNVLCSTLQHCTKYVTLFDVNLQLVAIKDSTADFTRPVVNSWNLRCISLSCNPESWAASPTTVEKSQSPPTSSNCLLSACAILSVPPRSVHDRDTVFFSEIQDKA